MLPTTHKPCTTTRTYHRPQNPLSPADAPNFCGFRYYRDCRPSCQIPYPYRLVGRPARFFHINAGRYSFCEQGHTPKQQVGYQVIWPRSGPSLYARPGVPPRFHLLCWTISRREGRAFCRQSPKEGARGAWSIGIYTSPNSGGESHLAIGAPAQHPYTHGMTGKCRYKGLLLRVEYIDCSTFRRHGHLGAVWIIPQVHPPLVSSDRQSRDCSAKSRTRSGIMNAHVPRAATGGGIRPRVRRQ